MAFPARPIGVKSYLNFESGNPEIRRFSVPEDVGANFAYLVEKIQRIYPSLLRQDFQLFWKDGDGDMIRFTSDEEMVEALGNIQSDFFKVFIKVSPAVPGDGTEPCEHPGVVCNVCDNTIIGTRFKCLTCPDYDLCSTCEVKGFHPEHDMLRIRTPKRHPFQGWWQFWGRCPGGRRGKCGRHRGCPWRPSARPTHNVNSGSNESFVLPGPSSRFGSPGHSGQHRSPGPYGHLGGFGPGSRLPLGPFGNLGPHGHPGPFGHPGPQGYPSHGEFPSPYGPPGPPGPHGPSEHPIPPFLPQFDPRGNHASWSNWGQPWTSSNMEQENKECDKNQGEKVPPFLNTMGDMIASYLEPYGIQVHTYADTPKEPCEYSGEASSGSEEVQSESNLPAEDQVAPTSRVAENQESTEPPKEIQSDVTKPPTRVQGVDITTVYKEQDKEQTEEQKKRAAHFREVIFQKKLEEATKQMQELGFNNEGGWMTQLLISKDCDITRVLDALHLRAQQK